MIRALAKHSLRATTWSAVALAACAGGPEPYQPGVLDAAQVEKCKQLERAYRTDAPEYPALLEDVRSDPVATSWIVRMYVRDLMVVREGRPLDDDTDLLRAAAGRDDPTELRALAGIETIGGDAVPTLVGDLLLHDQPLPRELGIELLARVGEPSIPALQQIAREGEPRQKRAAARALGAIGARGRVLETLRELAGSSDYTVRADAMRSLHSGGDEARALLLDRLEHDDDTFVRRKAAETLARYPDATSARALIAYLERSKQANDWPGELQAQGSLQQIAGTRSPRTPAAWRAFASELEASQPSR
jgi:HEAT repeat protein